MENASQALIMAAGIIIGVLILSLMAFLFVDFGSTSAELHRTVEEQHIVNFNSKFTSYIGKTLTIYDIVTMAGYARENNIYHENAPDEKITVNLPGPDSTLPYDEMIKDLIQKNVNPNDGSLKQYEIIENKITYHDNGRIKEIFFKEK